MGEAISAEDKGKIEAALKELKDTLANDNASKEDIDAKVKALSEASHKLAEAMYKKIKLEQQVAMLVQKQKKMMTL